MTAYQAGQKLGNYKLEGFLGYGGFAEVYLGKHIYLNTQAAIKVLQKQSSPEALEKFLQEARIIAGLKHPHIVAVLEFGIEEQRPFLVMAYAPHGTLRRRYAVGKTLPPTVIVPYVKQIADALDYAHERKIIHRDVKPENMLLDDHDAVLLSDFGLAMRERSTYHSVHSTDSAGTTIYMSPEQLRGKPCTASDQYALGVVMYEWLCGCLPFDGPDISIVVQHLHEQPVPLRKHIPTLPVEVEAVVLKALEKDPTQRFASVQELAIAFEEACKDIPVAENIIAASLIETSKYGSVKLMRLLPEALSDEPVELLAFPSQPETLDGTVVTPEVSWPAHDSSLHSPSLSAPLNMVSTEAYDVKKLIMATGDASTDVSNGVRISRRRVVAGIAGIGAIVGGVGIWRLSSGGMGIVSQSVQSHQRSSGGLTSASTTTGTVGTRGSSAGSKGAAKNGAANSVTASKKESTEASMPSSSPGGSSAAISTPGVTPVATNASGTQSTALLTTVQMSNLPSSVKNHKTTRISIMTNTGNISFRFEADYSVSKKMQQSDIINGMTNDKGNAIVKWTSSLPSGQSSHGYADLYVRATDQNGESVSSQVVRVQITKA